jgi:glycosyltransferase involved in cell wall biosynthesis
LPTYNNAPSLKECLRSLAAQTEPFGIQIHVSDNASYDDTVEVLRSFHKEYPHLHFRSNDSNIGFDANLLSAVQMAATEYVWLFGDRLKLLPNAVRRVCNILEENKPDVLLLNTDAQARLFKQEKYLRNVQYESPQEVLVDLCLNAGAVGDQIIHTKAFGNPVLESYVGKGWIHFAAIFEYLASLKNVDVIFAPRPSITYSRSKSSWIPNWFQIWDNWKETVRVLPRAYSEECKEKVIRYSAQLMFLTPSNLVNLRAENIYCGKTFRHYQEDLRKYANISLGTAKAISRLPFRGIRAWSFSKRIASKTMRTFFSSNMFLKAGQENHNVRWKRKNL